MMTVLLTVNGLLPGEQAIGAAAALLLVMVRLGLGFAIGGEYSGILVFLVETAEDRTRGFVASWSPATAGLGSLLAVGVSAAVTGLLSQAQLDAWGWRIPVFVGAALAASVLFLRRGLSETASFDRMRSEHALATSPLREALNARRALIATFLLSAVGSVAYYLNVTYVPTFLSTYEHVGAATALRWSTLATAVMLLTTPAFGFLADIVGRRWALALIGVAIAATTLPLYALLGAASATLAVLCACLLAVTAGAWSAASASAVPEQFPGRVRFSGIAIGYNAAVAIVDQRSAVAAPTCSNVDKQVGT
jgi:MHS family proline/betaine transporter-like MFS transporter